MNNHTPEPWVVDDGVVRQQDMIVALTNDLHNPEREWAAVGIEDADGFTECTAYCHPINAPRIVACVNGCKGIPDPETTVPGMLAFIEAAEGALASLGDHGNVACAALAGQARALLAKIEGGAE